MILGSETLPLPAETESAKLRCPDCRALILTIRRYGRLVNHVQVGAAQRKHMLRQEAELARLNEELNQHEDQVQRCEEEYHAHQPPTLTPHEMRKLVDQLRSVDTRLKGALDACERIGDTKRSPVGRMYEISLVTLRRLGAEERLRMPPRDTRIECRCRSVAARQLMLRLRTITLWRLVDEPPTTSPSAQECFQSANTLLQAACDIARASSSWHTMANARCARFQLLVTWARALRQLRRKETEKADQLKKQQDEAVDECQREIAALSADVSQRHQVLHSFLEQVNAQKQALDALQEELRKDGVWYAPVSAEEKRAIFRAMGLSGARGSYGGHWYTCPNGHVYAIGRGLQIHTRYAHALALAVVESL